MSAVVLIAEEEVWVKAKVFIYGTYAEQKLAEAIESEINRMWNHPLVLISLDDKKRKVRFEVEVECRIESEIRMLILQNVSYATNFVRIEKQNIAERSMMGFGLGQNSGHWLIGDNLGSSTTAAHEFGHALGLSHPDRLDYRGEGFPPLMAPRGTITDSAFQWNPSAEPGTYGGTMNPIHRRVTHEEVVAVMENALRVSDTEFLIGEISNVFFDEFGRPEKIIL